MNEETIVAVFDTAAHAQSAADALRAAGVPADAIGLHAGADMAGTGATTSMTTGTTTSTTTGMVRQEGFWASLFGGEPDHDTTVYDRSLAGGSTVVSVKTPEAHVARVLEILESHHPIDIDERAASYGLAGAMTTTRQPLATPAMPAAAPVMTPAAAPAAAVPARPAAVAARTGEETMQLSEETLTVGKRVVNRGGTRIRRFVVETPVEENVTLHDERVVLERRPVTDGRPVGADEFGDRTIEMTESAEEAVVSKTARVVEEIGLRKEATDRVETIRDTVRKEEVEVVQVPGTASDTAVRPATTTGTTGGTTALPKR